MADRNEESFLDGMENVEIIDYLEHHHAIFVSIPVQISNWYKTKEIRLNIMECESYSK